MLDVPIINDENEGKCLKFSEITERNRNSIIIHSFKVIRKTMFVFLVNWIWGVA